MIERKHEKSYVVYYYLYWIKQKLIHHRFSFDWYATIFFWIVHRHISRNKHLQNTTFSQPNPPMLLCSYASTITINNMLDRRDLIPNIDKLHGLAFMMSKERIDFVGFLCHVFGVMCWIGLGENSYWGWVGYYSSNSQVWFIYI